MHLVESMKSLTATALLASLLCSAALAVPPVAPKTPAKPADTKPAVTAPSTADSRALLTPLPGTVIAGPAKKITSVEGITEYLLPNGMKVLLFPDPSSAVITVNQTYLVGSRNEGYGETGMAHLLEHLMFKGSKNHPKVPNELSDHGARPNGTTWLDRTNYFETFQASDENLDWALRLESDRMLNSYIAKKDLVSEMTVVRNEFESGENDPGSILSERVISRAYLWHNYGNPTIGARSDIEKVPIDRLQAFYQRYYQPDNSILVVAGKIDEAKTLALIEKYYGQLPKPTRKLIPTYTEEPTQDGERTVTLRRVGDSQVAIVAYHCPPGSHEDFSAVELMGEVLSDSPSGRLYKSLVEPGKAVSVGGGAYQLKEPGVAIFSATVRKDGDLEAATKILIDTVEDFAQQPPTAEEVERARTGMLKSMEATLNSSERLALQLSEWHSMGDWRLFFLYRDRLLKVTPEDIQRVAKTYLIGSNRTLGQFIPTDKPERAEIPWVADPSLAVKNYKGRPPVKAGEAFDPAPLAVDKRDKRTVLPGGLKLAVIPKKTRGQTVQFAMNLRIGNPSTVMGQGAAPGTVGAMLMRGSKKHTREQIQDEFDRLKAQVAIGTSADTVSVGIETVRENLPATLKLVAEILREPAWNEKEFATWKEAALAAAEEIKSDPEELSEIALSRHMSPYPAEDPRYTETAEETLEIYRKLTLADVKAYYDKSYGASVGEVSVVGDFDAAEIPSLLSELFSDWKSPVPYERLLAKQFDVTTIDETIAVKDKSNAILRGAQNLVIKDSNPDHAALTLANYIIGGGFLNSRLATRIRQKEGLSYGVGSSFSSGSLDEVGTFGVYAISAPQNVDKVEKAMREEIARVLKEGFTADEVEKAKTGYLQGREGGRSKDAALARTLLRYQFLDRRFTWDAEYEKKIRALTPAQLLSAVKKFIDVNKISFVKAGDIKP